MAQMIVRAMAAEDIEKVSMIHKRVFVRQGRSREWVEWNFRAFPRMRYFVALDEGRLEGYIHWTERSGFREKVVLELEQLGVTPERQGQGIGRRLIVESLPLVSKAIAGRGAAIRHIVVTTRADNAAQRLYRTVLGAEIEATIPQLYSADEVFMIARDVDLEVVLGH
jgi:ribosomal protein S18 acetylase RimI-like enzyme